MPKIIKVIVSEFEREGRTVTQYHTLKGKFLAESDPGPRALFTDVGLEPTSLFWPELKPNTNPISRGMDSYNTTRPDPLAELHKLQDDSPEKFVEPESPTFWGQPLTVDEKIAAADRASKRAFPDVYGPEDFGGTEYE